MFRIQKSRRTVAVVGAIVAVGAAGSAYAYFTSLGSGTGSVTVGSATPWTVTASAATGGPLYPGAGTMTIPYTVKNASPGTQSLAQTQASIASSGGNVTVSGTPVPGCLAVFFVVSNVSPPAGVVLGGAQVSGSVTVTMNDSTTNQNACQGVKPDVTINAI